MPNKAFLLILLLCVPVQARVRPRTEPTPQKTERKAARRYKMKDIQDRPEPGATKFDQFLQTVGTVGLIYFWPGLNLEIKSQNANVRINSH